MPTKLNDTQIAEIVYKHTNGTSISALAKEYKVKWETIKRYIDNSRDIVEKAENIKNQTVTEWLKANSMRIQGLLDMCIDLLPKQLNKANARDLVGALKILTETSINNVEGRGDTNPNEEPTTITVEIVDNGKKG